MITLLRLSQRCVYSLCIESSCAFLALHEVKQSTDLSGSYPLASACRLDQTRMIAMHLEGKPVPAEMQSALDRAHRSCVLADDTVLKRDRWCCKETRLALRDTRHRLSLEDV